jgi:hypothetical protein
MIIPVRHPTELKPCPIQIIPNPVVPRELITFPASRQEHRTCRLQHIQPFASCYFVFEIIGKHVDRSQRISGSVPIVRQEYHTSHPSHNSHGETHPRGRDPFTKEIRKFLGTRCAPLS